jgi:hypothetical protein
MVDVNEVRDVGSLFMLFESRIVTKFEGKSLFEFLFSKSKNLMIVIGGQNERAKMSFLIWKRRELCA